MTAQRRRRRLPAELDIGHLRYTLRRDQEFLDREGERHQTQYAGHSYDLRQEIVVAEGMGEDYEADTVLHEVLHQCLRVAGYDPDADAAAGVKDIEERTIKAVCGPLLGALRRNPALVRYLVAAART